METNKKRLFFIVSHLESQVDIEYQLPKEYDKYILSEELCVTKSSEDTGIFKVIVFSISFIGTSINNSESEVEIKLVDFKSDIYSGKMKFNSNKNNFIYDFSFDILYQGKFDKKPPDSLNLSYNDKFCLFNEALKAKYQNNEELFNSLKDDSFDLLKREQESHYYYIDFYLSLFCNYYKTSKILELLSYFDLEKIKLTRKLNIGEISPVLSELKYSPENLIKSLDENEQENYKEIFYTLLLYYTLNYDADKVNALLDDKKANKYYQKILYSNDKYFNKIQLQNSFIDEIIINGFNMNYNDFILTLNYLKSLENILVFINRHTEMIYEILKNKKSKNEGEEEENEEEENEKPKDEKINLCEIIKIKLNGKLSNISREINTLLEKKYIFEYIEFGDNFWRTYSEFFNMKNLNILLEIKKILNNIKNKNKDLVKDITFINKFIHDTGIDMSKGKKFRNNIEILEFIRDKDIYYTSKNYKNFRDVHIFVGLNLSMGKEEKNEFLEIWNSINFNEMFDEDQYSQFQIVILSHITHIPLFHLLFQLFGDYNELNSSNYNNIVLFKNKYNSLIQLCNKEKLDELKDIFIDDSANLIYILEQKRKLGKSFIQNDLIKNLPSSIMNKIFFKLLSKFQDLSDGILEEIANYFSTGRENLICENLINNFKSISIIKCKKQILNKISGSLIVDKNMVLYDKEKNQIKVLIEFTKLDIFDDSNYKHTQYVQGLKSCAKDIIDYIINFKITYNELSKMETNILDLKTNLIYSLEIINIEKKLSKENIEDIVNKILNYKKQIKTQIDLLNQYLVIDQSFYEVIKYSEILELEKLLDILKNKNLLEFDREEHQNKFKEYKLKYTEDYIKDRLFLSASEIFKNIYKHLKKINQNFEGNPNIFEDALKEFTTLKYLFEKVPNKKIRDDIFEVCLETIRGGDNKAQRELSLIQNYFNINEENIDFESISKSLKICAQKNQLDNIIKGILLLINCKNAEKTKFSVNLKIIRTNLNSSNFNTTKINNDLKELSNINFNIFSEKKEDEEFTQIFSLISNNPDAFFFLIGLKEEECRNFQEMIDFSDNNFLNLSDYQNLEKCRKFLSDIMDKNNLSDKNLIENFLQKAKKEKSILLHFQNFFNNYPQFKDLKSFQLDKNETNLTKYKKISTNSVFQLSIKKESDNEHSLSLEEENAYILFEGEYYFQKNKKKLTFSELLELREISMLNKNFKEKEEKKIIKFTENIKGIINLYYLLEKIAKNGYHEELKIKIIFENNEISYNIDNISLNGVYQDCEEALTKILTDMEETKSNAYKNNEYELILFIYGKQFSFLFNCLKEKKFQKTDAFLNYLTNNLYKKQLRKFDIIGNFNEKNKINNFIDIINNCNSFIQEALDLNDISIKDIYEPNIISKDFKFKYSGFYSESALNMDIEETIISYYNLLTNHYPIHQTILICNRDTSSDELISFMHRAVLCPFNVLFILGRIEELTFENCQILSNLISVLPKKIEHKMNSCLVFMYTNNNSEITRHIEKLHYSNFESDDKIKNLKENIFGRNDIEIYYSNKAGVGKSTKIKNEAEKLGKKYIYFPLGGEFNKHEVFSRLKKINLSENMVFHLDLYDTKSDELLKEFLFSILITKVYKNNENIYHFDKEIDIKIELPYGFYDFFNKFPLLKMFKNKTKISYENLPPLIVSKEINSDIQILCNYLRLYKNKKLKNSDLYIPKVSSVYFKKLKNKINAELIPNNECKELIYEFLNIKFPNYYQIDNFIKILSGQFKKFSLIKELSVEYLKAIDNANNNSNLINERIILIDNIIKSTQYFISCSFEKLLKSQNSSYNLNISGEYDIKLQNQTAIEALIKSTEVISYNNIQIPLVFLHQNQKSFMSIVSPDYSKVKNLRAISTLNDKKNFIKDYKKFTPSDFYQELKMILNLENPIDKYSENKNNLNTIKDIVGYYVITPDNFFKMLLILLRIREKVPVIMMGETGCGKTSLIRKLNELLNNGEDKMKILNIHSGINNEKIIEFLFSKQEYNNMSIIEEAKKQEELEQVTYEEFLKKGKYYEKRNMWIFFDEINTCNSLGLISELICKHSCNGIPLPDNIVFIGACNPYRTSKFDDFDGLKFKNENNMTSNLVYTVNPLPHCLLNYVLNFGSLTIEDEIRYIENIIKEPIEKYYLDSLEEASKSIVSKVRTVASVWINWILRKNTVIKRSVNINDLSETKKQEYINLFETAKESVIKAQNFIREKNDVSSVSLREIRRFGLFYEYFENYLSMKKKSEEENEKKIYLWIKNLFFDNLDQYEIYKYSIILSIFMCYYLRIRKKEERKEFEKEMNKIFVKNFGINFLSIPNREKEYIINNINLPKGIAKNEALLNNVFVLFVCITSKIPLFIVGKPGCSKSLSVQLLFNSMKGEDSEFAIFKNLPKLFCNSYQGSLSSTSQGILKIFEKARRILKQMGDKELDKVISLVYIDEMGLAEHSPNNPLKVFHSELEYDLNDGRNKISFVGISNWKLDASKMNRGIYLSIPVPDEKDLIDTSKIIVESFDKSLTNKNEDIFVDLARTYHSYMEELKENIDNADFHGARDFYNLIKVSSKILSNKYQNNTYNTIETNVKQNAGINSIERNLAGLKFNTKPETTSLEKVKQIFQKKYETINISKKYEVIERIKENINDLNNRYLLLVTNSATSEYLIYSLLNESYQYHYFTSENKLNPKKKIQIEKEIIRYNGSKFFKDQNSEEYTLKIINKIQVQMEKQVVLILKDLEGVYPSLYDLFNQNFTNIGGKNYARLSVGYSTNTFSFVNTGFKCIVLVDEKQISEQEPPFLNRFEKHIIDFEYLLNNEQINLSRRIMNIRKNLEEMKIINGKKLKYDISKLFINFNKEEIQGIIYYLCEKKKSFEDIEDFIFQKISMVLPQDIILLIHFSENNNLFKNEYEKIIKYYKESEHSNLINYLKKCEKNKTIIYTFSRILEPLLPVLDETSIENNFIETNKYGKLSKNNIRVISVNSIDSENKLETEFDNFYKNKEEKLFIFKFSPEQSDKIGYLKNYIEERERNNNELKKKSYIFIMYLKRIFDNEDPKIAKLYEFNGGSTFLNEDYYQIFIDNLNGLDENIVNLIGIERPEDLIKKCLVNIDTIALKNIYSVFSYFRYTLKSSIKDLDIKHNNYSKYIVEYLTKSDILKEIILKEIYALNLVKDENVLKNLFISNRINQNSFDYISELIEYFMNIVTEYLKQFIFKSERKNILSSFLNFKNNDDEKKILGNKFIKYTLEKAFQEINQDKNVEFINQLGFNQVEVLLGIKIPGISQTIKDIISFINDKQNDDISLAEKFFQEENYLRNFDKEYDDEKKLEKNIEKLQNELYNYLLNIPLFKKIYSDIDSSNYKKEDVCNYFNMLYDDYLLNFLSNNFDLSLTDEYNNELIENWKILIKKLVKQRFEEYDDNIVIDEIIKKLSRKILWIESNSKNIILTLLIYKKLFFIQLLNEKIDEMIKKKQIKYECGTARSPLESKKVNECFFIYNESMIKLILRENNLYNKIGENLLNFINTIKEIYHYYSQINYELYLFSKELSNIKYFIDIEKIFNEIGKHKEENIKKLIEILIEKNKLSNEDNKEKEISNIYINIKNLFDFLKKLIGKHNNFPKLINEILFGEFMRVQDENFREKILELILSNENIIKDSTQIFIKFFNNVLQSGRADIDSIENGDKIINEYNSNFEIIEKTLDNNEAGKIQLEQVLLNIFESFFIAYFNEIQNLDEGILKTYFQEYSESKSEYRKNDDLTMLNLSLDIFKNKILRLENIYFQKMTNKNNSEENKILYPHISKLYSIAYIKIYLYKVVHIIIDKDKRLNEEILKAIRGDSQNDFRKIIKIYILKLINHIYSPDNFHNLQKYRFKNHNFTFFEEFEKQLNEHKNEILNYYFIPTEKKENFDELNIKLGELIENRFDSETKSIDKFIEEDSFDIFYCAITNIILSNIDLNDNEDTYNKFSPFAQNLLNNSQNISPTFKKLLSLLTKSDNFNKITRKKLLLKKTDDLISIDYYKYEIILTCMRFCLQTTYKENKDSLYYKIISENITDIINKYCLPGLDDPNSHIINNYYLLENHLNTKSAEHGAYVCSCGTYYEIAPCGFPTESYECPYCKKMIGGTDKKPEEKGYHKMILRDGHYRIFKNIEDKKEQFEKFKDTDELIPNMLLSEYKNKIIDPLLNANNYGIPKIDKITFIQKDKIIRNLSQVGYRLLNLIFYSHIFFSDCLGNVKNNYSFDNMSYIDILVIDWNLLKEALFEKGITVIQIFLNLIFDDISSLLKNCGDINNSQKRIEFENKVENILKKSYDKYPSYAEKYLSINQKLHNIDPKALKSIILELYNPEEYDEKEYPFLKYFMLTKYSTEESFMNELYKIKNYDNLYPLISSYINPKNSKIGLLKYLPKYNKFLNSMINYYSYKISRKEADSRKLKDEKYFKENCLECFQDFIEVWENIKKEVTQYKCHQMEEQYFLNPNMPLINFLVDDGEINKGMYLAGGYELFIKLQNEFLKPITRTLDKNKNGILYYFNKNLKLKIDVQKATNNEIIMKDFLENSIYINFLHLIDLNSYRNIFFKNEKCKINYLNYNSFTYDFETIEEELGKILLSGKRLFNDTIHFVTYTYEGFRGEKSSTLIDFINIYPPEKLEKNEKQDLFNYIKDKKKYGDFDFTQLLFSIQQIIYYLTQEKMDNNASINEVINSKPQYLNISDDCKNLFEKLNKLRISKLFELFSFLELFCFDSMTKNLRNDYNIDLSKEQELMIDKYFKNGDQKKIEKIDLASFCRRLVSRYLISKRNDNDINPDNKLSLYLSKSDLWNFDIINYDLFDMEINNIRANIPDVKVSQTFKLCNFLDPENTPLEEINKMIENNKQKKEENIPINNKTKKGIDKKPRPNKKKF